MCKIIYTFCTSAPKKPIPLPSCVPNLSQEQGCLLTGSLFTCTNWTRAITVTLFSFFCLLK